MFRLLKFLFSGVVALFTIGLIIYFLPREIKIKGIEKLTGIVPESLKDKAEELMLTPPEQREKLIEKLENNLEFLKSDPTDAQKLIKNSEDLIAELKEKNKAASLTEILSNKIAERLVGEFATKTQECLN